MGDVFVLCTWGGDDGRDEPYVALFSTQPAARGHYRDLDKWPGAAPSPHAFIEQQVIDHPEATEQVAQTGDLENPFLDATDDELAEALEGHADGQDDDLGKILEAAARRLRGKEKGDG